MRFYPFGSSSLNQLYNPTAAITASVSNYATSASYGIRIVSASYAISGSPGIAGSPGTCSYVPGIVGNVGPDGNGGRPGGISTAYPSGSGY